MRQFTNHAILHGAAIFYFVSVSCSLLSITGCGTDSTGVSISSLEKSAERESDSNQSLPPATSSGDGSPLLDNASSVRVTSDVRDSEVNTSTLQADVSSSGAATSNTKHESEQSASTLPPVDGQNKSSVARVLKAPSEDQLARWGDVKRRPLHLLLCHDGFGDSLVQCLTVSPDGTRFVLGGAKLTLWNIADAKPTADLLAGYKDEDLERPIRSASISPDGALLAAGDQKGMLRIWNLGDQQEIAAVRAHDARLIHLAFSPDSQTIATTSYSGEVRLWESSTGKSLKKFKVSEQQLSGLAFLSDNLLAVAGAETSLWDTSLGEKRTVLSTAPVVRPALGLSPDRQTVSFVDADSKTHFWDVSKGALTPMVLHDAASHLIEISSDRKHIATLDHDSNLRIRSATTGQTTQVIDANGARTAGIKWHPSGALLIASEAGRFRIWGTTEMAAAIGLEQIPLPLAPSLAGTGPASASSAQLQSVIDIRSFPKLPGAVPQWSDFGMATYHAAATQEEAEQFYRYALDNDGWTESITSDQPQSGLSFSKDHCKLNISFQSVAEPGQAGQLQVNLQFAGSYDVRQLPRISPVDSKSDWSSFSFVSYRSRADLTELEVALLQQFHALGWTPYSRLNASSMEDPLSRNFSLLNKGNTLNVFIRYPSDSTEELAVQMNVSVTTKSLPIPPDAGWIEFDASTDLQMVANTGMDLKQTVDFFDREMKLEGWLTRDVGREIEEGKGWLPYLRGQQDVLIRLVALPKGGTRIIVGDAERSSWQLEKPPAKHAKTQEVLLEAADFMLPKGASDVKFELDQKQILFELADATPQKLAAQFIEQMQGLEWKKEDSGVMSDDYVLVTCSKGKAEIQLRARAAPNKTTAMISGDGLAWTKPLPAAPVRISYGTWLRRERKEATLNQLDEFRKEMLSIPVSKSEAK